MRRTAFCFGMDAADLSAVHELARRRSIVAKADIAYQDVIRLAVKEHLARAVKHGELCLDEQSNKEN